MRLCCGSVVSMNLGTACTHTHTHAHAPPPRLLQTGMFIGWDGDAAAPFLTKIRYLLWRGDARPVETFDDKREWCYVVVSVPLEVTAKNEEIVEGLRYAMRRAQSAAATRIEYVFSTTEEHWFELEFMRPVGPEPVPRAVLIAFKAAFQGAHEIRTELPPLEDRFRTPEWGVWRWLPVDNLAVLPKRLMALRNALVHRTSVRSPIVAYAPAGYHEVWYKLAPRAMMALQQAGTYLCDPLFDK